VPPGGHRRAASTLGKHPWHVQGQFQAPKMCGWPACMPWRTA